MDRHLLIIDDEPGIGAFLCKVAEGLGFVPFAVDSSEAFWSRYDAIEPAVIVLDLKMPNADGVEILRALSETARPASVTHAKADVGRSWDAPSEDRSMKLPPSKRRRFERTSLWRNRHSNESNGSDIYSA